MTTANYLTKALVMYDSLLKECKNGFTLYYFAFDEETYEYLIKLNYEHIVPVPLKSLEASYPELVQTKSNRTIAEYFFTCSPHILDYVLKVHKTDHITYLDADLVFYNDPMLIIDELKNDSVLITEHRHFPTVENHPSGKYCVQFIPFVNDKIGNQVITWWKEKCIEWCYLREEDGKFGDQGYLNQWPELFENIVVMEHRGGGVAQWNFDAYDIYKENNKLKAFNKEVNKKIDVIFYHYQGLRIFANNLMILGIFSKDKNVYKHLYVDYVKNLSDKENEILAKLNISRKELKYQEFNQSKFNLFLVEIRRIFFPKKGDRKHYYKYLNKYRWLP